MYCSSRSRSKVQLQVQIAEDWKVQQKGDRRWNAVVEEVTWIAVR